MNLWKVSVELDDLERQAREPHHPAPTFLIAIVAAVTPQNARDEVIKLQIIGSVGVKEHRSVVNQLGYSTSNKAEVITWGYHSSGRHSL